MEEKTDSEHSYSGESNDSSNTSGTSSSGDDEAMEVVNILGHTLEVPPELCEDYGVFREVFSMQTWEDLEDDQKDQLKEMLPKFNDNTEEETDKTLKLLFNSEPMNFTSPLTIFFNNLSQGNYQPDIARMKKFLHKARAKQHKHKLKTYYSKLLPEVILSRERLLTAVKCAPPGSLPCLSLPHSKLSSKSKQKPYSTRVKERYFEELAAIRSEVGGEDSEDDIYPEGPPEPKPKRRRMTIGRGAEVNVSGTLGNIESSRPTSMECLKSVLAAHRARRQYRDSHPELNTLGITLEDIKERVAFINGAKKLMFGGQKLEATVPKTKRAPKKDGGKQIKEKVVKKSKKENEMENKLLTEIKSEKEESDSESFSLVDPTTSPKSTKAKVLDNVDANHEVMDKYQDNASVSDLKLDTIIKQEPPDISPTNATTKLSQPIPIRLEDLDGIDMMALPVELADDSGSVAANTVVSSGTAITPTVGPTKPTVVTASSTVTGGTARSAGGAMATPATSATNTIASTKVTGNNNLATKTSTGKGNAREKTMGGRNSNGEEIESSLTESIHANFMSLVRALFPAKAAHRASYQQLQQRCAAAMKSPIAPLNTWYSLSDDWCGELESALDFLAGERGPHPDDFVPYLQYLSETKMYQWIGAGRDCDSILARLCERWLSSSSSQLPSEPPPPRYPTTWVMRPPTNSETAEFRAQERRRFSAATKPFTYIQHGYRSVVGPCMKGGIGLSGVTCGGQAPLVASRPRSVTLLALVRDAVARLPNGEGTKHHVFTMLKMSQWIAPCSEQTLLTVTTTALEKLLTIKGDPVVKYDQRTAIWTYLHRHRSEEDWMKSIPSNTRRYQKTVAPLAVPSATAPRTAHTPPATVEQMDIEVGSVEEVIENASDSDVDVDDSSVPTSTTHLSSAQLLMQAQASQPQKTVQPTRNKPTGKLVVTPPPPKPKTAIVTKPVATKPNLPPLLKQPSLTQIKQSAPTSKPSLMAQCAKQASVIAQLTKQNMKPVQKQINLVKQNIQTKVTSANTVVKPSASVVTSKPVQTVKTVNTQLSQKQVNPLVAQVPKSSPSIIAPPQKSPLLKQRPLQKIETPTPVVSSTPNISSLQVVTTTTVIQVSAPVAIQNQNKLVGQTQGPRSLLIRPPNVPSTVTASLATSTTLANATPRRGVVRVLSPAMPSSGKSLISPRALMQQGTSTTTKKRPSIPSVTTSVTTVAQSSSITTVVSSIPTAITSSLATRTVQLPGGRTVQLANQTVHLPGGQAVQLTSGHALQLSSLQLPTHSVRLPSGQTVQLASPQAIQAVRAVSAASKNTLPRVQQNPSIRTTQSQVQLPVSTVQLAGQTVQIGGQSVQLAGQNVQLTGQSVQLAGQSVQLTGHTLKLPSGQSVQVASQSVQLPSGQTVQLGGNVQTVLGGQNVQLGGQSVQLSSGQSVQTVQLAGQTVQLPSGQTVQLPSGQTVQLPSGQTIQLSSGQTLQLASGQTVQLANQTPKSISQVVRTQTSGEKPSQPIVAKLLTNAQGQMISLEGVVGATRTVQVAGGGGVAGRAPPRGMRVVPQGSRPLLLTSTKPLHNIILQQSDGSALRVTSSGGVTPTQTIVLSNMGAQASTTSTATAPILKLHQVSPIQQVKLPHGVKIQQTGTNSAVTPPTVSGVRSVLMDGQQLKLVAGRHVLARLLRPAHPQQ